jgi:transcriptional regulator with XRE-family HTH domain
MNKNLRGSKETTKTKTVPHKHDDHELLLFMWSKKKAELKLSQKDVAELFGVKNQTAISQYLNGRIPLNLDAAVKFSKILQCNLSEIAPSSAAYLRQSLPETLDRSVASFIPVDQPLTYITCKDDAVAPFISAGDTVGIDPDVSRVTNGIYAIKEHGGDIHFREVTVTKDQIVLSGNSIKDSIINKSNQSYISWVGRAVFLMRKL